MREECCLRALRKLVSDACQRTLAGEGEAASEALQESVDSGPFYRVQAMLGRFELAGEPGGDATLRQARSQFVTRDAGSLEAGHLRVHVTGEGAPSSCELLSSRVLSRQRRRLFETPKCRELILNDAAGRSIVDEPQAARLPT